MPWWNPITWLEELVTPAQLNQQIRDNLTVLKTQIADDGKSLVGSYSNFTRLHMRTHTDLTLAPRRVIMLKADEIIMNDGYRVSNAVLNLEADFSNSGAGGLDTGAEAASTWYEIFAIRKSSDGSLSLMFHRVKNYLLDEQQTTVNTAPFALRAQAADTKDAQSFQVDNAGQIEFLDLSLAKVGTPTGSMWATIEADSAGSPSGTPLATSNKLDVSLLSTTRGWTRLTFTVSAYTPAALTTFWIVLQGDYAISSSNYVQAWGHNVDVYARGSAKKFDGAAWTAHGTVLDAGFKLYTTENNTALVMPSGWDQSCRVGFIYNDSSGNLVPTLFKDNRIIPLTALVMYNAAAATPMLVDASAFIPPTRGLFFPMVFNATAADVSVRGVPDGYFAGAGANFRTGGCSRIVMPTGGFGFEVAPVFTEFQGLYVVSTAGSLVMDVGSFEW